MSQVAPGIEASPMGNARVSRDFRQEAIWNAMRKEYFALLEEHK